MKAIDFYYLRKLWITVEVKMPYILMISISYTMGERLPDVLLKAGNSSSSGVMDRPAGRHSKTSKIPTQCRWQNMLLPIS